MKSLGSITFNNGEVIHEDNFLNGNTIDMDKLKAAKAEYQDIIARAVKKGGGKSLRQRSKPKKNTQKSKGGKRRTRRARKQPKHLTRSK